MDAGEQDSHVLHHIKQINTHLSSLALTANALPPSTQPQKHTRYVKIIVYQACRNKPSHTDPTTKVPVQ